jgi:hypothetical protein
MEYMAMSDLLYLALGAVFLLLCVGYAHACDVL